MEAGEDSADDADELLTPSDDAPEVTDDQLYRPSGVYLFRAPDRLFVNLELVRQGYARVDDEEPLKYAEYLAYYQAAARKYRRGNWGPLPAAYRRTPIERNVKTPSKLHAEAAKAEPAVEPADGVVVYVTKSGEVYHRAGCYHLRNAGETLSLDKAKQRKLRPCRHCKPPE